MTQTPVDADAPSNIAIGTRLAIIRHGEAWCNTQSFIGGHRGCKGLTPRGFAQVHALARRLEQTGELAKAAAVYASILPRAIQSTEVLMPALGGGNFVQSCDLCERHPGVVDGITWAEYEKRYRRPSLPGDVPTVPLSEGGESWVQFVERADKALTDVAKAHPGELVVVVAHGGIIDSSMINFLGLADHGTGVRLHPEHASITEWEFVGTRWRLVRYSDAGHLDLADEELRGPAPFWVHTDAGVDANSR